MRIAALDLGSNSFHLLVADAHPDGRFEPLLREKEMLRLGDDVGRFGRILDAKANEAVAVVKHLVILAESAGAEEIVVKGTAALRDAENGSELVDRMEAAAGVDISVIGGREEAHLIYLAVRAAVALEPAPALVADLGGGSLELIVGDHADMTWSSSVPLGVGRLTGELVRDDPPSAGDIGRLRRRIAAVLAPYTPELERLRPRSFVGTSGTIVTLARMAALRRQTTLPLSVNQLTVGRRDLDAVHADLLALPAAARARLPGLDPRRSEIIPAGSVLVQELMDRMGLEELTVSDWAMREGMVIERIRTHDPADWATDPRALRHASVIDLARRCRFQEEHAYQVTQLATELFDQTLPLHRLGATDRELLAHATLLHDIGEHVSADNHERHSAYLVSNGRLRGFSPEEVAMLSSLVRFHRRGSPYKANFDPFDHLAPALQERVVRMEGILRVADALDRSHTSAVHALSAELLGDRVRVRLVAPEGADIEVWGLRRKRELFQEVMGRPLEVAEVVRDVEDLAG